jgi:hypothetical protein
MSLETASIPESALTISQEMAASLIATGKTKRETAALVGIAESTLYRWLQEPEFQVEVDRLTYLTGMAVKAARVRAIKRLIESKLDDDEILDTKTDVFQWMKLLREELGDLELGAFIVQTLQDKLVGLNE